MCYYKQNSSEVFVGTDIKGGVAITYYDVQKMLGPIGTFTHFKELNSILKKVENHYDFRSRMEIISTQSKID